MPHGMRVCRPYSICRATAARWAVSSSVPGGGGEEQPRHQVLEHGPAPRHQPGQAGGAGRQPAELEPVLPRHLAAGDRQEAGEAASDASRS